MLAQPFFILNFSSARNYMNTDNGWYKKNIRKTIAIASLI